MRLKPRPPARVVWEEGMFLAPHHFQAQRRNAEDALALALDALFPFAYGVASLALDEDALRTGAVALRHARGILPDGTPFALPEPDPLPAPLSLGDAVADAARLVYLALPAWRDDTPNVAERAAHGSNGDGMRFVAVEREVVDEVSGTDAARVRFAAKQLRLVLDVDLAPNEVALPVARVRRDGAGGLVFDSTFVPPCLQIGASVRLVALLEDVVRLLDAKGSALTATLGAAEESGSAVPSAYLGNEVATRWLLHATRSAEAPLRHLLQTRHAHPEQLWLELLRLAGALCTFSLTASTRELPTYAHDDLAGCFGTLERHLRTNLDLVVSSRAIVIPLVPTTDVTHVGVDRLAPLPAAANQPVHVGTVTDPRCFEPGAEWFLAVRSSIGAGEIAARVPVHATACASAYVLGLVLRQYARYGLGLEHVPAPPAALAPLADRTYFRVAMTGKCAELLADTRQFGIVLSDAVPDPRVELVVLAAG